MKVSDIVRHMPRWYKTGVSVHLSSAPGRGKSTIIEAAPDIIGKKLGLDLGVVIINAAMLTPMHVLGFGVPKHSDTHSSMVFTDPFFWVTSEGKRLDQYDGGIIFIDEADKADVDVKKVLGEGRLTGRFGPHRLPPGWVVWSAGNRASDRSGSTKSLDHEINRTLMVDVQDDLAGLLDWMNRNGALPLTKSFTEAFPQIVLQPGVPDKQGPWPTPRSTMLVDRVLHSIIDEYGVIPDEYFVQEEIAGLMGDAAAQQFMAHIRLELRLPKFDAIVADPTGTAVPGADAPDARMLVCYNCAHRVDKSNVDPVITYIKRLPDAFAVTFFKAMLQRAPMLSLNPSVKAWMSSNNALMNLMHSLQIPA